MRLDLYLALGAAIMLARCLAGCATPPALDPAIEAASYRQDLERCRLRSSTCAGYVLCRQRVEAAHGRTYAGRCEVTP